MKKMKKSTVRKISKWLNAFVVLMMVLQPVGMPSILRAIAASDLSTEAVSTPAPAPDLAPKEDSKTEPAAPVVPKETPAPMTAPKVEPTPSVKEESPAPAETVVPIVVDPAPKADTVSPSAGTDTQTPADATQDSTSVDSSTIFPDAAATDQPAVEASGQVCLDDNAKITDSAKSDWDVNDKGDTAETKGKVELGVKYIFPGEENVSVTFNCLPSSSDDRTTLKIQQIASSDITLPDGVSAASEYAYDITTGMKDGDFKYDLTLPKSDVDGAEVKYIEKTAEEAVSADVTSSELKSVDEKDVKEEKDYTKVSKLDHFTIFFTATLNGNQITVTSDTYKQGDTVYVKADGLTNTSYYYQLYLKPVSTSEFAMGSSCVRGTNGSGITISASYDLPSNAETGTWTAELYRFSGTGSNTCNSSSNKTASQNSPTPWPTFTVNATDTAGTGNNAGIGANVNGPGSAAWSHPEYITTDDNNYATSAISNGHNSEYLQGTNYGFNIPSDATINGITVSIMRQRSSGTSGVNDVSVNLLKAGAITGANRASASAWPTSMAEASYGDTGDLWETAWTPSDINNSNFGVSLSVSTTSSSGRTASVDYMQIAVTYTIDTTPPIVAVEQAAGQADPTGSSPANFTATFSEPVTDFAASSITLGGTAGATTAAITDNGNNTYNIAVSGMTKSGTVTASIAAGVAHDVTGNPNTASTSSDNSVTFNYDPNAFDKGMVTFSFDDGDKSAFNNRGVLGSYKGTYYVDTMDMIGATEGGGQYYTNYMTAANLQTLYNNENEIGAHSRTHVDLSTITDPAQLQFETDGSRLDLLSIGVKPVSGFAYPYGTVAAVDKLKSAGFVGARTVDFIDAQGQPLYNTKSSDRYGLYAAQVNGNTPITPSDSDPAGFGSVEEWIDGATASNKWLILVFHEIKDNCGSDNYCITPSKLSTIVSYLQGKSSAADVVTVKDGLAKMGAQPSSDGNAPVITQDDITVPATVPTGAPVAFSPTVSDSDSGLSAFCTIPPPIEYGDSGVLFPTVVTSGYTFPMGATTVTCTAADTGGNLGTKTFTVTVTDAIPPTTTLSTTALSPTNSSAVPVTVTFNKDVTGFDATDIVVTNGSVADFSGTGAIYTFNVVPSADGTVTVDIPAGIAQDSVLNFNTAATQLLFVSDRTAPVIAIVQPDTNPAKSKAITASVPDATLSMSVDAGAVCNDTLAFAAYADTTFSAEADNGKTVCYKAEDSATNISYLLSAAIAGIDTTAPTAPANLLPDTGTPTSSIVQNWNWDASTDLSGITDYIYRVADGATGTENVIPETSTGNNTFVLTNLVEGIYKFFAKALDFAGNESLESFFTLVVDTTAPVIASHEDVSVEATSSAGATVSYSSPVTSDNYDEAGVATCLPASGSTFALGDTTVTCTATDTTGNPAAETTFKVTVIDSSSPVIDFHDDEIAEATSSAGAIVNYTDPNASDVVDGTFAATCLPASGSTFALGDTTATCTATDMDGNIAAPTTFRVTVEDTTAPVITPHGLVSVEATSSAGATVSYSSPVTSDNYDEAGVATCLPASGSTFALGDTTVVCTEIDFNGNVAALITFKVIVSDNIEPVVTITAGTDTVEVHSSFTDAGAIWTDNYDGNGNIAAATSGTVDKDIVGNYTLTYSYTDTNGNSGSADRIVHVVDTIAPSIPTISLPAGDYMTDQSAELSSTDDGIGVDKIYFTTDGSEPDNTKTEYIGAIAVDKNMTIKAIAYDKVGNASDILTATYGIAPVISAETSNSVSSSKATIKWNTDDPATSRVVYDTVSHPDLDAAPNYGYANSTVETDSSPKVTAHSVQLTGLSSGTTYYYRVISHGSPETVGVENSFKTSSSSSGGSSHHHHGNGGGGGNNGGSTAAGIISAALAAVGRATHGTVAGDEAQQNISGGDQVSSQDSGQSGEVLGEQQIKDDAATAGSFGNHPYLYTLLGLIVLYLLYFAYRKMSKKSDLKSPVGTPKNPTN